MNIANNIIAIDPANEQSAFVIMDKENYQPMFFDKVYNDELIMILEDRKYDKLVIEMVSNYGLNVGASIFETCVWIGRFVQIAHSRNIPFEYIYRKDVKKHFGVITRSKEKLHNADSQIRTKLINRFGVVGVKSNQGYFYGFKSDIWQSYAVGVTYLDRKKEGEK